MHKISFLEKIKTREQLFINLSIFLYIAQLVYFSILHYLGHDFPETSFLFDQGDRFNDWNNSVLSAANLNPYFEPSPALATYFPFSYLFFYLGSLFNKSYSILFYISTSITVFIYGLQRLYLSVSPPSSPSNSFLTKNNFLIVLLILLFEYPTLFCLDRGNLDLFLSGIIALALSFYFSKKYALFGFFIAIASAFKGFPLIFLILLLKERRFYTIIFTIGLFILLNLCALMLYKGGIFVNFASFLNFLSKFKEVYLIGNGSLHFFSDFYNFGKLFIIGLHFESQIANYYKYYSLFITAFLLFASYCILFRIKDNIEACGLCIIMSIVYPCAINDYKLTMLYSLLILLLTAKGSNLKLLVLLACILSPKNYFIIHGLVNSNVIINPILLFFLIYFYMSNYKKQIIK
jgi:hypothetical protein